MTLNLHRYPAAQRLAPFVQRTLGGLALAAAYELRDCAGRGTGQQVQSCRTLGDVRP